MSGTPDEVRRDARVQEVYTGHGTPPVTGRHGNGAAQGAPLLQFERVNAFYGKSHILNDATLDVREGEIVALLGRNGAGKSTLAQVVVRPAAAGVRTHSVRRPGDRRPAGARHRALGAGLRAAGPGPVRRHDGGREPGARSVAARHRQQSRRGVERSADLRVFPAPQRAPTRGRGLSVRRRAANGRGGARAVGQREAAAARRAVRRPRAGGGAGAVQRVRPPAQPGVDRSSSSTTSISCWRWPTGCSRSSAARCSTAGRPQPLLQDLAYRKKILWL